MRDDEEFLRRRLPSGRFVSTGAVAKLLEAVVALERAAGPLTERPPDRLTHILGNGALHDADRAVMAEACVRIRAVASALSAAAATPRRRRDAQGDTYACRDSASARHSRERHNNRGLRKRCGCARSKWNKCAHSFHFNYKPDVGPNKGKHFRISLDKHLQRHIEGRTEAEREARNLRTAIDEGRFGVPVPTRDALTVEQLLRAYLRDYVTSERPRSVGNVEYQIAAIARTP